MSNEDTQPTATTTPFVQINIDAPPKKVWKVLTNITNWSTIIENIDDIHIVQEEDEKEKQSSGDVRPSESASDLIWKENLSWDETRTMFGRSETQRMTLTQVTAPTTNNPDNDDDGNQDESTNEHYSYTVTNESCGAKMEFYHQLVSNISKENDNSSSSRLEIYYKVTYISWLAWSFSWMAKLMQGQMKSMMMKDLEDIRDHVEQDQND